MKKAYICALASVLTLFVLFSLCATAAESSDAPDVEGTPSGSFRMSYGYSPLVAPDGAMASDYVKGPTPPTEYVAAGGSYTVAQNSYTFRDYVFAGWACGGKVYKPGETVYNVSSDMTFIAQWARAPRPDIAVSGIVSYSSGGKVGKTLSAEVGSVITLEEGLWQDGEGRVFEGGSSFLLSFLTAEFSACEKPEGAVSVSYTGAGSGIQCPFSIPKGVSFTVDGCFEKREGFVFGGWQCGDGLYMPGDSCTAEADTVLTAVWREETAPEPDYCSVTVTVGEGGKASPSGKSTVVRGESFTFTATADEGYALSSVVCGGSELGTGGEYTVTVNEDTDIRIAFEKTEQPTESAPEEASALSQGDTDETGEPEPPQQSEESTQSAEESAPAPAGSDGDSDSGSRHIGSKTLAVVAASLICILGALLAIRYSINSRKR